MNATLITFAIILAIIITCMLIAPKKRPNAMLETAAAHSMTTQPTINYSGNPNRIGAYVYIMETDTPNPEHDWAGTFIGMRDGLAMVRDRETNVVAHVSREQLYAAMR